ncbi:MAG: DNA topoisomerase (ATP-hydrolyzing) subunit A, partial [Clostridia bacterium]|nr:DNA topoisomerase (ATP-hydrolyzing) subunit A [Clostridia bacterium]
ICGEIFRDIDRETVEFTDNYDGSMKEPRLLPTAFPNVLVSANTGIAVGMASQICGFNLEEVCRTEINYLSDPDCDLFETMPAPDFSTGAEIVYDRSAMDEIYRTGRGSFKMRSRWRYIQKENIIEIYEIPFTTTSEAIVDKVAELIKAGKIREINDMRDETDLSGLKLAVDLKRGTDPEKLMQKLFKLTPLMDSFSCNFNILVAGNPKVMGVREILGEWTAWRTECIKNRVYFEMCRKKEKLHLLQGLAKILLDIDKAISIIRNTELESDVIPNLMMGFGIDKVQAEYVAEIKLRNINKEYILKRTSEIEELERDIAELEDTLKNRRKVKAIISSELKAIIKKYPSPRRTGIVYASEIEEEPEDDPTEDYPVNVFLSNEGYLKKITPQSLRMSGEQKYKDGDGPKLSFESTNRAELLVFTDRQRVYKTKLSDFADTKASALGTYLPSQLEMDDGERVFTVILPGDYKKDLLLFFENGKIARIPLSAYETKTNRKKLVNAYSDKSPLAEVLPISGECDVAAFSSDGRALVFNTSLLQVKASRSTQGVAGMSVKNKHKLVSAALLENTSVKNKSRYRVRSLPGAGALLKDEDRGETQMSLID